MGAQCVQPLLYSQAIIVGNVSVDCGQLGRGTGALPKNYYFFAKPSYHDCQFLVKTVVT